MSLHSVLGGSISSGVLSRSFFPGAGKLRIQRLAAHIAPQGRHISARAMSTTSGLTTVEIKRHDDQTVFNAYVVGSEGAPGVVVLQEWWGVDFEIKNHATNIAKKGFQALIPEYASSAYSRVVLVNDLDYCLYRGKVGLDAAEAHHLMEGLDWQGAVKDVVASVKWLKDNGSPKVGVTGFCMGGALTLASAVLVPGVDAVVAFYGTPDPGLADLTKVKIPVQAHFGELDSIKGFSDKAAAEALTDKLKTAGVPSEVFLYPGQGHAFMNASEEAIKRKQAVGFGDHDQNSVDLAWSRCDAWFDKYLKV